MKGEGRAPDNPPVQARGPSRHPGGIKPNAVRDTEG